MTEQAQQTVRIRPQVGTASGRRQGWIKHVVQVDESRPNGYAFDGDFLRAGRETDLPVGAILIRVDPCGSVKNGWKEGHVLRLEADGELTELTDDGLNWYDDFLTIRDTVTEALAQNAEQSANNPLAGYSDDAILAEARKRGLIE